MGLSADGYVYTWGSGSQHRLGFGSEAYVRVPKRLNIRGKIADISVGSKHAVAITETGQVLYYPYCGIL